MTIVENRWTGKTVIVGICGSIAAYRALDLIRMLKKMGAEVIPAFSSNAGDFVTELTVAAMAGRPVYGGSVITENSGSMDHITLARKADLVVLTPASANTIAKFANGFADDPLTTLLLAFKGPVVVAPSMNTVMWEKIATQKNVATLKEYGYTFAGPEYGLMACGEMGAGRLAELDSIEAEMFRKVTKQDYAGKRILMTAGPTREALDPVRYISNHSSGKMGWALARAAWERGAEVTLVHGPVNMPVPYGINGTAVDSADEMHETIMHEATHGYDLAIMTAAVADFKPANQGSEKIKKEYNDAGEVIIPGVPLTANKDILADLVKYRNSKVTGDPFRDMHLKIVGFGAETGNAVEKGRVKFKRKGCEFLVVNDVSEEGSGFGSDTNKVVLLSSNGDEDTWPTIPKDELANILLNRFNV